MATVSVPASANSGFLVFNLLSSRGFTGFAADGFGRLFWPVVLAGLLVPKRPQYACRKACLFNHTKSLTYTKYLCTLTKQPKLSSSAKAFADTTECASLITRNENHRSKRSDLVSLSRGSQNKAAVQAWGYLTSIKGINSSSRPRYRCTTERWYSVCTTSMDLKREGIGCSMASFIVSPSEADSLRVCCSQSR